MEKHHSEDINTALLLNKLFKSIIDHDRAPVVVCDLDSVIVYMNPASVEYYHCDLTRKSLKACHNADSNVKIDRVLEYFAKDTQNNLVYTSYSEKENKDIYMVALRDTDGTLIGYYEKHEFRNREGAPFYQM